MNITQWMKTQKQRLHRLMDREPGNRFQKSYRNNGETSREGIWTKILWIGLGVVLVVVGTLLSLPPGLPGFLLWVPGLVLIIARVKPAAQALDWLEVKLRRLWRRVF